MTIPTELYDEMVKAHEKGTLKIKVHDDDYDWTWGDYAHPGKDLEMKPNEWWLTILQVAAPIVAFSFGIPWLGWFLVCWLCFFGIVEVVAKKQSGKTLSQWVWTLPRWKRILISVVMVSGMGALAFHFIWGLKEEPK